MPIPIVIAVLVAVAGGLRCETTIEADCVVDGKCAWDGGCYKVLPVVGYGECRDSQGNIPNAYVSRSETFRTAAGGQCESLCSLTTECLGVRVLSSANFTQCVMYTASLLSSPPTEFDLDRGVGVAVTQAWGDVKQTPSMESDWVCKTRYCDEEDCACGSGVTTDCGVPSGFKGMCSCTSTATFTVTQPTATATFTPSVTFQPTPTVTLSVTQPITPTATHPITPTVPYYDECGGQSPCGADQTCTDPSPTTAELYDFVCRCKTSWLSSTGSPVPQCDRNECSPSPCHSGQKCTDPNTTVISLNDFICTCNNQPLLKKVGGPVATCATATLDECMPSPCFVGQTCVDPNVSLSSTNDYVCSCPNGGPFMVGGSPKVCEYNECKYDRCGVGQTCIDQNTSLSSLHDWLCRCDVSGATSIASVVPVCVTRTNTATLAVPPAAPPADNATNPTATESLMRWEVGDTLRVAYDLAEVRAAVEGAGLAWVPGMVQYLGQTGVVVTVTKGGNYQMQFADGVKYTYPTSVLSDAATPVAVPQEGSGGGGGGGVSVAIVIVVGLAVGLLCLAIFVGYLMWSRKKEVATFSDGHTQQGVPMMAESPDPFTELLQAPPAVLAAQGSADKRPPSPLARHSRSFEQAIDTPPKKSVSLAVASPPPLTSPPLVMVSTNRSVWGGANPLHPERPVYDTPSPYTKFSM